MFDDLLLTLERLCFVRHVLRERVERREALLGALAHSWSLASGPSCFSTSFTVAMAAVVSSRASRAVSRTLA
jgi:hypothetical protein